MKKQTMKVKTTKQIPMVSQQEANESFAKSIAKRRDDGANSSLEKFLQVMKNVTDNASAFSLGDVVFNSRVFDIPLPELTYLFKKWCEIMESKGKLEVIQGCYDQPIFLHH